MPAIMVQVYLLIECFTAVKTTTEDDMKTVFRTEILLVALLLMAFSFSGCALVTKHSTQRESLMTPGVSFQMGHRSFVTGNVAVENLPEGYAALELMWSERDVLDYTHFRNADSTGSGYLMENGFYWMTADAGFEYTLRAVAVGPQEAAEEGGVLEVLPLKTYAIGYTPVETVPYWREFVSQNPKETETRKGNVYVLPFKKGHIIDIGTVKLAYEKPAKDAAGKPIFRDYKVEFNNENLKNYINMLGIMEEFQKGEIRVLRINVLTGEQIEVEAGMLK